VFGELKTDINYSVLQAAAVALCIHVSYTWSCWPSYRSHFDSLLGIWCTVICHWWNCSTSW